MLCEKAPGKPNCYCVADRSFNVSELRILMDAVQASSFITPKKTEELVDNIANLAYWDVLPAAKANETVVKDKDSAITTSYTGKYGTQTTSDLSKRTSTNTKQTVINRVGASQTITAVNTYQSSTSEKIIKQDDGMSLVRTYTYDAHGNVIKEEVTAKNNASLKMKREYSYTSSGSDVDGNALFSEADENGNSTNYAYESGTGF